MDLPRLLWAVIAALLICGCAEVTEMPSTAPVMITVVGWPGIQTPIADVELCETGTANCVTTDGDGKATLDLPVGQETSFTRTKLGHAGFLLPLVVPANGTGFRLSLAREERIATQHGNVMSPYPMGNNGAIVFSILPNEEGATIELFGATSKKFYTDSDLNWRLDLTATTTEGGGGFTEVGPGDDYRIEFAGTAEGCEVYKGWEGPFANSLRLPVQEGFLTDVAVICP